MKLFGMLLLFCGAAAVGLHAAQSVKKVVFQLGQLKLSLEVMRCEIDYALTPAGKLFRKLGEVCRGEVGSWYKAIGTELINEKDISAAAKKAAVHCRGLSLPENARQSMEELFASFGGFDLEGQLRLLALAEQQVGAELTALAEQKKSRCRCYEILGVCTGLALMILAV